MKIKTFVMERYFVWLQEFFYPFNTSRFLICKIIPHRKMNEFNDGSIIKNNPLLKRINFEGHEEMELKWNGIFYRSRANAAAALLLRKSKNVSFIMGLGCCIGNLWAGNLVCRFPRTDSEVSQQLLTGGLYVTIWAYLAYKMPRIHLKQIFSLLYEKIEKFKIGV